MPISNIRVLIVDDDNTNLEMSAAVIECLNIAVDKASSGKEAIEKCATKTYQLIFMDLEMPELDGYKTAQVIKSMKNHSSKAAIIALTATLSSKEQVVKCMQSGMKDCMIKPLDAEDIKNRLHKWNVI